MSVMAFYLQTDVQYLPTKGTQLFLKNLGMNINEFIHSKTDCKYSINGACYDNILDLVIYAMMYYI